MAHTILIPADSCQAGGIFRAETGRELFAEQSADFSSRHCPRQWTEDLSGIHPQKHQPLPPSVLSHGSRSVERGREEATVLFHNPLHVIYKHMSRYTFLWSS